MPHHAAHHRVRLHLNKKQVVKRAVLAIAIIEPAMTLPQIYEIWIKHEAAGVSVATWGLYISAAFVWLMYGLQLKDKALLTSSVLWIVTELAVVVGALIYG